jgi:adenine-specific DNA-methyltransferase
VEPSTLSHQLDQSPRKDRGAFFTPASVARYVAQWGIRSGSESVLEPSCGESIFLIEAAARFANLQVDHATLVGVEIDSASVEVARSAPYQGSVRPTIVHSNFFDFSSSRLFDTVIGNPPFIRFHQFAGTDRAKAQAAALRRGVRLSGRASSWAAFVIHATSMLRVGGRVGFVLPAEFLHVDYASEVRKYVLENFRSVDIVNFDSRVFDDAQTDVVLLLADGYHEGTTGHARLYDASGKDGLENLAFRASWKADREGVRWSAARMPSGSEALLRSAATQEEVSELSEWGDLSIGVVTGANSYFTLSEGERIQLGIPLSEVQRLAPPLRPMQLGLAYSREKWDERRDDSSKVWLFTPSDQHSAASENYLDVGVRRKIAEAYKCRVRSPWWRVPTGVAGDVMLGYMSSGPLRLIHNPERLLHLNSIHRLRLKDEVAKYAGDMALASLNSMTLLSAESSGRTYGGGVLKMEIREARSLLVPAPSLVESSASKLLAVRDEIGQLADAAALQRAIELVDRVVLIDGLALSESDVTRMREAHETLRRQRHARSKGATSSH